MAIELRLTSDQLEHYEFALMKAKIPVELRGNIISLNKDNFYSILGALRATHAKSFNLKTKSITHFERLFNLEVIIKRLLAEEVHFKRDPRDLPTLDEFLEEEGIKEEVTAAANANVAKLEEEEAA